MIINLVTFVSAMEMMFSALTQHVGFVHFSKWQMSDFSFQEGKINVLFPILPTRAPTVCDPMDCSRPGSSVHSVQFSSVTQLGLILCDTMDFSTPGLPVHHQLPESPQTHVY